MLRCTQAMARIQARASSHRSYKSEPSKANIKISSSRPLDYNSRSRTSDNVSKESPHMGSNWLNQWMEQYSWNNRQAITHEAIPGDDERMEQYSWNNRQAITHEAIPGDDERSDKILEIDTWKPQQTTRRCDRTIPAAQYFSARNDMGHEYSKISSLSRLSAKLQKPNPNISSEEVSSIISPKEGDQVAVWTAESSPRVDSASSRPTSNLRGPSTPTRSECSRSLFADYLGHPNYMANAVGRTWSELNIWSQYLGIRYHFGERLRPTN